MQDGICLMCFLAAKRRAVEKEKIKKKKRTPYLHWRFTNVMSRFAAFDALL